MTIMRTARIAAALGAVVLLAAGAIGAKEPKAKAAAASPKPAASPEPSPAPASPPSLNGSWASEPFDSPMGRATQTFCFRGDGTLSVKSETPGGPHSSDGTYKLEGGELTVTWPDGRTVQLSLGWTGGRLVLTDPSGVARTFHRTAATC